MDIAADEVATDAGVELEEFVTVEDVVLALLKEVIGNNTIDITARLSIRRLRRYPDLDDFSLVLDLFFFGKLLV